MFVHIHGSVGKHVGFVVFILYLPTLLGLGEVNTK
jgi:hypothetical protein